MLTVPDVSLAPMLPILIVLGGALISTLGGFWLPRRALALINMALLLLSGVSMVTLWNSGAQTFGYEVGGLALASLRADNAALLLGGTILIGTLLTYLVTWDTAYRARVSFAEFDAVLMYAVTGCLLIAFSGDLIVLLIGLEIMSLASYVLTTLSDSPRSEEAGLKYFLLGSAGSAVLIYGIALLYGATGSFNYAEIAARASAFGGLEATNSAILVAGSLLLLCGFGFKVALAPFHQWTPDVYSGAPTSVSLFLSTVVKVAAFAGMLRVFSGALVDGPGWLPVLAVFTGLTLAFGNAAALFQTNFKRLLAYSAIAHSGFLAMTLLGPPNLGGPAMSYYLLIYTLMTGAALAIVAALQRSEAGMEIQDMRGLFYRHPAYAAALAVCLASLAGLPPFAGFFSKLLAFQTALQGGYLWVTVLGVISSVAALIYYMRPALLMFMPDRTPAREYPHGQRPASSLAVALSVTAIVMLGVLPGLWYDWLANPEIWRLLAGR